MAVTPESIRTAEDTPSAQAMAEALGAILDPLPPFRHFTDEALAEREQFDMSDMTASPRKHVKEGVASNSRGEMTALHQKRSNYIVPDHAVEQNPLETLPSGEPKDMELEPEPEHGADGFLSSNGRTDMKLQSESKSEISVHGSLPAKGLEGMDLQLEPQPSHNEECVLPLEEQNDIGSPPKASSNQSVEDVFPSKEQIDMELHPKHNPLPNVEDVLPARQQKDMDLQKKPKDQALGKRAGSDSLLKPSTKRPRVEEKPRINAIRSEIAKAARNLRRAGIVPISLFFPSLPSELRKDVQLQTAIGGGVQDLKTLQAKGKKMAWATFSSEGECLDKLLALRLNFPRLIVSLHRPKQQQESGSQTQIQKNALLFDKKVADVLSKGGLGNTLMFRNLPAEVENSEFQSILEDVLRRGSVTSMALRTRSALSKGGAGRNFWVVYSSIDACKMAFGQFLLRTVSFRCGKTVKLHPTIHDDSTDADERKRRGRAAALGTHRSRPHANSIRMSRKESNLDFLESFLRSTQKTFIFLPPREELV